MRLELQNTNLVRMRPFASQPVDQDHQQQEAQHQQPDANVPGKKSILLLNL